MKVQHVRIGSGNGGGYWLGPDGLVRFRNARNQWTGEMWSAEFWDGFRAALPWSVPLASGRAALAGERIDGLVVRTFVVPDPPAPADALPDPREHLYRLN